MLFRGKSRRRYVHKAPETPKAVLLSLMIYVFVALLLRSFLFEPFNIPSGSMHPNLQEGDYLFVSKYSYGYSRYSFPFAFLPFEGRILETRPQRGDIVVFRLPQDPSINYIKRVIGLPGDRIQVKSGRLYINDLLVRRENIENHVIGSQAYVQYEESFGLDKKHRIIEIHQDSGELDNTSVYFVPENHYFFMGDNRDNSADSRVETVGFVPFENFVGKAQFIFFSLQYSTRFYEIWKWPSSLRYSRFFKWIE